MIAPTPFFADRGCHVRIYEEIKALTAKGCEIILCTYHNGREVEGVKTARIINVPWYRKLEAGPSWQKPFLDILLLLTALGVARRFKPALIHAHLHEGAFIGLFLSKCFHIPLVFDCQGSMTAEMADHGFLKKGVLFKTFRWLEGGINRLADVIITSSGGAGEQMQKEFDIAPEKIETILDGVDAETFCPGLDTTGLKEKLEIPDNRKVVVYLGLLNKYQGVDLLIQSIPDVLKQCRDVHFLLMGYPDVERYKEMAMNLGVADYVTIPGKIDYSDAPRYLCLGNIAVSAKLSRTEANGKIYNYMAAGLPTVCFDTPVNREILRDLGVYADYGERESLVAAMVDLLSDTRRIDLLSATVRKRGAEELSWQRGGEKIRSIYERCLN